MSVKKAAPAWLRWGSTILAILMLAGMVGMVFFYAPVEKTMGFIQKVFYFHISSGWVGMFSFLVAAVASVLWLANKQKETFINNLILLDTISLRAVQVGLFFSLIVIITGMFWAKATWGVYWVWEPRLTTVAIMFLIYAACLLLRQSIEEPTTRARISAIYTIIGFLSVPITFLSIRLFPTIHPLVVGTGESAFNMDGRMTATVIFSLAAFTILYLAIMFHLVQIPVKSLSDPVSKESA